jgi:MFS family permease
MWRFSPFFVMLIPLQMTLRAIGLTERSSIMSVQRVLRTVLLVSLGFQITLNMTRPMISLYASSMGANAMEIGVLTAAYAFLPLLFAVRAGKLADRIGDKALVVMGTIGTMLGLIVPYLFPGFWTLLISQGIVGISHIFINLSLQNVLGHTAAKEQRDHYFSMLSMSVAFGGFLGPVVGGYLADHFTYSFVFLVASLTGIVPFVLSFFVPAMIHTRRSEEGDPASSTSTWQLLKLPLLRKALASSALVLYSRDIYVAYFPLFAEQLGLSGTEIGWIIAIQGLAMMTVRLFLARLANAFGRSRILLASILTAGFAFLMIPLTWHTWLLGALSICMGVGLGCGQPLSMTTAYNASPKARTGEVLGLRLASNRLSQLLAPLAFGMVGQAAGLIFVFYISGIFLIGGAFLTRGKD